MTDKEKIMFRQWIKLNGGKGGSLYLTFTDEALEQFFLTAISVYKKKSESKNQRQCKNKHICNDKGNAVPCYIHNSCLDCRYKTTRCNVKIKKRG